MGRCRLTTWMWSAAYIAFALIVTNVPMIYLDEDSNGAFVGVMIPFLTILAGVVHYFMVSRPLYRMTRTLQQILRQHTGLIMALENGEELTISDTALNAMKRLQQQMLDGMQVSSMHAEVFLLEARVKDLALQYVRAQQHRLQDRLLGTSDGTLLGSVYHATLNGSLQQDNGGFSVPVMPLPKPTPPVVNHENSSAGLYAPNPDLQTRPPSTNTSALVGGKLSPTDHMDEDHNRNSSFPSKPSLKPLHPTTPIVVDENGLEPDYQFIFTRGDRFEGDGQSVCIYIERSKNKNTVVYEGRLELGADISNVVTFNREDPLDAYWLDLEPSYQERSRLKGKMDDREELNFVEKKMAYGINTIPSKSESDVFVVKFVAVKSKTMVLRLKNIRVRTAHGSPTVQRLPVLITFLNGIECIAERIYVQAKEPKHVWSLPSVEYIEISGVDIATGDPIVERIPG